MFKFLDRVGVSDMVLKLIPEICQSCKICREWAKPGPDAVCSTEIADTFNAQVEVDLLFVEKHIIFHMIDRCTRFHCARVVPNREDDTLIKAINEMWISTHGPMGELISDNETGIKFSDAIQKLEPARGNL